MLANVWGWIVAIAVPLAYVLGALSAIDAIMKARTPQGSVAWTVALLSIPFLALPFYWLFGRTRFADYDRALEGFAADLERQLHAQGIPADAGHFLQAYHADPSGERGEPEAFQKLATVHFTRGNDGHLLINGDATFSAIFEAIEGARHYVLAQFYTIHDDQIGRAFQQHLIAAARRGVRVHLLYDDVGSHALPRAYKETLVEAGVATAAFSGRRGAFRRFRLNFRNHRKIVVVDGEKAFVGGLNVGDEYLGRDPKISPWRDTHLALRGPIVQGVQHAFCQDWYYSRGALPDVRWTPAPSDADRCALVLASGPDDALETCGLLFAHAIEAAETRVWIATPYFVPDGRVLGALQVAALRGVDVRILMPRQSDSIFFKYVPYAYFPEAARAGVKVFLYEDGFMHQKVMLVDTEYAAVGTANMDNRSFRLNFELTVLFNDEPFARDVARMLEGDLARSTRLDMESIRDRPFAFHFAARLTRLFAPVL